MQGCLLPNQRIGKRQTLARYAALRTSKSVIKVNIKEKNRENGRVEER